MLWISSERPPKGSHAGSLLPNVVTLRGGGTFKRWGQEGKKPSSQDPSLFSRVSCH